MSSTRPWATSCELRLIGAGILPRAKALALRPDLADVELPAYAPGPQDLATMPAVDPEEESPRPSKPSTGALPSFPPDDDIPF